MHPTPVQPTRSRSISQSPHPAVVRVITQDKNSRSLGSGTLIHVTETHGLVLTNWHVVRDAVGPVEVVFPDGFRSGGTVIKVDKDWDLAAIGIWRPRVDAVDLANQPPQPGEKLTIAGYGSGSYRAATGQCLQYLSPGDGHPFEIVELATEARQGDSGGPIFNDQGQLAGVLLGASQGRTVGSYCGRVGNFLANVMPVLDHQQKEMIANVESNPSADVNRNLATMSRGGIGTSEAGGPLVPNRTEGEAASARVAANPLAANPLGTERFVPQRNAATRRGVGDVNANDLVAIKDDKAPWEDARPWSSAVQSTPQRPMVADARSSWTTTPARRRAPAVLAANGNQVIALDKIVGTTPIEQTKAFLAIFGVVSMLIFLLRSLRGADA